jgi:hypothetical protein
MKHRWLLVSAALAFALGAVPVSEAQRPKAKGKVREALVDQVRPAIRRGVQFLRDQEAGRGDWELDGVIRLSRPGGETALALLALLNSGVTPDDPVIGRGLKYLRGIAPRDTYVVGLQTMVFAAAGKAVDREKIQRNVDWLVRARVRQGNATHGWGYTEDDRGADNSNTQYALLGLHEGHQAGAKIDRAVWEGLRDFYIRTQVPAQNGGGWGYHTGQPATLTMTTAGLCGLYIAGLELNEGRETLRPDGTADRCGVYAENRPLAKAHAWINDHLRIDYPRGLFYNLYGVERTGRLSGQRFLGGHDWYREGCEFLVRNQNLDDGSWSGRGTHQDGWPVIATSFSLLFLSKGRTPVLVSKLVHGPGDDWNNDRYDARNLTAYVSRELFKRQPLAWQIFDAKRARIESESDLLDVTAELLQSPILYFNGHQAPQFNENEERLLKEYVDQGGFILAEACCGRKEFDEGFRALVARLFPGAELKPLPPEHPLWRAHALVPPGSFNLLGIEQGCKTVVVYSPQDLSCLWETGRADTERGQLAFRLGGNIVAYATGMELPKPRLTQVEVVRSKEEKKVPRGYLKVAQLRHSGDWQPAPRAMRNLMAHLRDGPRLDVDLQTEPLYPNDPDLQNFKFLYLHGRADFTFSDEEVENLRADLKTGGLLLADACCGKKAFDKAFRAFAARLFPDAKLEPVPLGDELYGAALSGEAIRAVRCRRERADGAPDAELREGPPFLEGIKYRNRWVVIYSKYDLGCALEKHQSSDCLGHDYESALKLASAAVYYAMKR